LNILFDTHCHLCLHDYTTDLDSVIQRAFDQGVRYMLIPGLDVPTSQRAIEISEKYQDIYAAVGFHPNTAGKWDGNICREMENLAHHPKVVAIGEIGLDQYHTDATLEEQEIRLREQLQFAVNLNKPVLLHNRGATSLLLKILNETILSLDPETCLNGVFHAFGGDADILHFAEQNKFLLGIGGMITFPKSAPLQQMAGEILSRTILETDSPVLAPLPYRGKRNEPAYLPIICKYMAGISGKTENQISKLTTQNARLLLGIKLDIK